MFPLRLLTHQIKSMDVDLLRCDVVLEVHLGEELVQVGAGAVDVHEQTAVAGRQQVEHRRHVGN